MFVYVLECMELQDNGNDIPVLHGIFATREMAADKGEKLCRETDYLVSYDVTECDLQGFECNCRKEIA